MILNGLVAKFHADPVYPIGRVIFLCFVNFLKSEEEGNEIILLTNGPVACESNTFLEPQHCFETRDASSRSME